MTDIAPARWSRPRPGAGVRVLALLIVSVLGFAASLAAVGGRGIGSASGDPPVVPAAAHGEAVGLLLDLVPSPQTGPAPLSVNVTASIGGGTPPYSLTVCFGAADHTSPNGNCQSPITGWTGTSPVHVHHVFATGGNFSILGLANDSAGESVGSTALVVVTSAVPEIVSAVEQTTAGFAPLSVTFNESVAGASPPLSLSWLFGDGSSTNGSPGTPITHVYAQVGTYQPLLTVRDATGHQATESLPPITVNPAPLSRDGIVPGLTPIAGIELVVAFFVAATITALTVVTVRRRRWRREGDELVDWLRDSERSSGEPSRTP